MVTKALSQLLKTKMEGNEAVAMAAKKLTLSERVTAATMHASAAVAQARLTSRAMPFAHSMVVLACLKIQKDDGVWFVRVIDKIISGLSAPCPACLQ